MFHGVFRFFFVTQVHFVIFCPIFPFFQDLPLTFIFGVLDIISLFFPISIFGLSTKTRNLIAMHPFRKNRKLFQIFLHILQPPLSKQFRPGLELALSLLGLRLSIQPGHCLFSHFQSLYIGFVGICLENVQAQAIFDF